MYNDNFRLIENPFGDLSDPKFVYLGGDYQSAFENIRQAIKQRAGLLLLTGPPGIGKTTIVNQLVKSLRPDTTTVLFQNKSGDQNLIRYICDALGLSRAQQEIGETQDKVTKVSNFIENINELDVDKLLDFVNQNLNIRREDSSAHDALLKRHLSKEYRKQRNLVVFIDNTANLSRALLDDAVSLVTDTADEKKIQLIVTCTPEVGKELRNQHAKAIASTYRLSPLDTNLIEEYIMHLMRAAGFDGKNPFASDTLERILDYSKGIPSQINALCQSSIFTASFEGQKAISPEMIEAASLHQTYIEGVGNTTSSADPASPQAEEISQGLAILREQRSPIPNRDTSEIKTQHQNRSKSEPSHSMVESVTESNKLVDEPTLIERLSEIQYKNSALRSPSDNDSTTVGVDKPTRNGLRAVGLTSDVATNSRAPIVNDSPPAGAIKPTRNGLRAVELTSDVATNSRAPIINDSPPADADNPTRDGLDAAELTSEAATNSYAPIIQDKIEPVSVISDPEAVIEPAQNPTKTDSVASQLKQALSSTLSVLPLSSVDLVSPKVIYPVLFLVGLLGYLSFATNLFFQDEEKSADPEAQVESLEKFAAIRSTAEEKNPVKKPDSIVNRADNRANNSKSNSGDQTVLRFADLNSNTQNLLPDLAEAYLKYTGSKKTSVRREDNNNTISVQGELTGVTGVRNIVLEKAGNAPILLDFINRDGIDFGIASQQLIGSNPFQGSSENLPAQQIIAIAGIAVIVHPANPAMIISHEQIADILSGLVTNWWQLDQRARGINIYLPGNNTSEFYERIMTRELGEMFYPNNVQRFQDESKLAEKVAEDTNALGIVRVPYIGSAKSIAITSPGGGPVLPSQVNIISNEYPFSQPIYLYTNDGQNNLEYEQFTRFMQSDTAKRIIRANGFIPFKSPEESSSSLYPGAFAVN